MTDEVEVSERIQRIIWKGAGIKTARQLAEETGLPPEKILAIKRELLESVDVLTVQQRKQRLIIELESLSQVAREAADNASDERNVAGLLNAARGAMKDLLTELNRASKSEEQAITALNSLRQKEIVDLYIETVDVGVTEIAEKYGIPEDELFDIFNARLREAAKRRELT